MILGEAATFTAVLKPPIEARIHWHLLRGEEELEKGDGPRFTFTFEEPGTYRLVLVVEFEGNAKELEHTITVRAPTEGGHEEGPKETGGSEGPPPSEGAIGPDSLTLSVKGDFSLLAAGDVTGDGKADLFLGRTDSSNVLFLQNRGNGVFTKVGGFNVGITPERLLAADLTGNSLADLLAINWTQRRASLLIAIPGEILPPRPLWVPKGAWEVLVDQLNDNPGLELVWLTHSGPKVWSFSPHGNVLEWASPPKGLSFVMVASPPYVWADIDGDGKRELVFYSKNPGEIEAMKLGYPNPITLGITPTSVPLKQLDAADLNGDGVVDVIGMDYKGNLFVWFMDGRR